MILWLIARFKKQNTKTSTLSLDTFTIAAAAQMTFLFLLTAALVNGAIGGELRITSVDEFIQFKDNVNSGKNYSGTTVFLESDLSLAGETFEPIGNSNSKYFLGVFDGQGHVISNLEMTSSSRYVGLFGYSKGLTIKNVILDSSCSFTNSVKSVIACIGGIIGECRGSNEACAIENSVNMGSVAFNGNASGGYLFLGGIAGDLSSFNYDIIIKNCANYGDVTHSGESSVSSVGGIVGYSQGNSSTTKRVCIYNSLNHGTITHNGTTSSYLFLGGITGYAYYTTIENCVSGGKISLLTTGSSYNSVGSIVGEVKSGTSINYAYFTSDLSGYNKYGEGNPSSESNTLSYDSTSFELSGTVSIGGYTGTSLIDALNGYADYYTLRDYSRWLLNKGSDAVSFTINKNSPFTLNYQIILLPSLVSEGYMSFNGWYTDEGLTTPLTEFEVTKETELYGKFEENTNSYTISFDTRREGVSVAPITAPFGSVVTLLSGLSREYCTFLWWETKYGYKVEFNLAIPSHSITLYAVWKCTHIETPEDFVDFSKVVNNGTDYYGTTVFLDSDLSLAGKTFEPIGNKTYYFNGTFDGQGHVISNLKMTSLYYAGLFGYSGGLTIKNVILDSSCSITSSFNSVLACIGGFIGECRGNDAPCTIENSVNMGSVTFSGNASGGLLFLGGIAGGLFPSYTYDSTVKNCANYGDVTHSGESSISSVGGIVGYSQGNSSLTERAYIYNCLNHGTITHNGTTTNFSIIGGITGYATSTTIENCVSAGKIPLPTKAPSWNYIGSIVGYAFDDTTINYTYFTSDLSDYKKYGSGSPSSESNTLSYDSTSFELNETVSVGSYTDNSLIDSLNCYSDHYKDSNYSHWLLNKGNNAVTFAINGRTNPIKMDYQIILLPSLASEGIMSFDGWYTDNGLTTPLTEFEVTSETKLYGSYCGPNLTVNFDPSEGSISQATTKDVTFGSTYGELPNATRTGYTFLGWFTEKNESVTAGSIVKTPANHTLYAQWLEIRQNQVEIVFAKKDMGKDEIEEVIKKYTEDAEFTITIIESSDDDDGIRVIIEFIDTERAESFIETVEASSDAKDIIKTVGFVQGLGSFSVTYLPMSLLWLI